MKRGTAIAGAVAIFLAAFAAIRGYQEYFIGDGPIAMAGSPSGDAAEVAFVANAVDGAVTVIDVASRQVVGTIDVIPDGRKVGLFRNPLQSLIGQSMVERSGGLNFAQDLDVSPDGRVLYVSRGNLADVAAFDLLTGRLLWRRAIGVGRSDHMAITPDGRYLFVSALADDRVKRIHTRTARLDGEFVTGVFPHDNQISADGRLIYNASLGDMTVAEAERDHAVPGDDHGFAYQITVADAASLDVVDRYRFPRGIRPLHLSHDGRRIYAQLSNTHDVVEYDIGRRAIVRRLSLPVADGVTPDDWDFDAPHHGLAMTRDGKLLCVAGRASDYAGIVSTQLLALVATVPVADAPSWAAIDRTDRWCLTANNRDDSVSIVSLADRKEVARLPAGRGAKHIALARVPADILAAIKARGPASR